MVTSIKTVKTEAPKARMERLRSELRRRTGCPDAAFTFGTADALKLSTLPTGIQTLDPVLGGGLPRGGIVEIYGPSQTGKTTLGLQAIAQSQWEGNNAAFVDAEHRFNPTYAQALGVNLETLIVSRPENGDDALEAVIHLVKSGDFGIVVVDSVAALVPASVLSGTHHDFLGVHCNMMSAALARLSMTLNASDSPCIVIFLNQVRETATLYGNPEVPTGGNALAFFASVRLELRSVVTLKNREGEYGIQVKVKAVKTGQSKPNQAVEVVMLFGKGFQGVS